MNAYERLMAEAIPTRPPPPPPSTQRPWTPEEQAQHRADLMEALDGWHSTDPRDTRKRKQPRQLRLVTDHDAA